MLSGQCRFVTVQRGFVKIEIFHDLALKWDRLKVAFRTRGEQQQFLYGAFAEAEDRGIFAAGA